MNINGQQLPTCGSSLLQRKLSYIQHLLFYNKHRSVALLASNELDLINASASIWNYVIHTNLKCGSAGGSFMMIDAWPNGDQVGGPGI